MGQLRLGVSPLTKNIYVGKLDDNGYVWKGSKQDVTEDFLRCVVNYCTEEVEFVVDGMRFKATCERIK